MKCKYCEAELEENNPICPNCGRDNAASQEVYVEVPAEESQEVPVEVPAEEPQELPAEEREAAPEAREKAKMSASKLALVIVAGVVLLAVLVSVILLGTGVFGGGNTTTGPETTADTTAATEADPTVPSDGNPDDETCKGTYTADTDAVKAANATVVATMGDKELTNGELQVYYWMGVYNFLSYNSNYLSYYGLDLTQSLDTQVCPALENGTWQQYFLAQALLSWQRFQALTAEAETAGFQLDKQYAAALEELRTNMEKSASEGGYESLEAMLEAELGAGCTFEDYENYMYEYYMGYMYYDSECGKITVTDDEIAAYFEEHKTEYESNGITEEDMLYDVRHILIQPEDAEISSSGAVTATEEQWEACRAEAQALLDDWLANDGTEEGFADLAKEHSVDGNAADGGIYTDLTEDTSFVEEFKNWYLDENRKSGDTGLVKTTFGYHIMFFVGSEPAWPTYAETDLLTTKQNEFLESAVAAHPIEVDYSAILLGNVTLVEES